MRHSIPIVIAHRGASGYVPEHTLTAYRTAIESGADYIEPDLVMTRDGVLVARHENEISATTDVEQRPEYAARRTTKRIDGAPVSGWFTEDFTLEELKRLRARERLPELRPANTRFDGMFDIPTFEEILQLVAEVAARRKGVPPLGIYPETKHPSYFAALGLPLEEPLAVLLKDYGYTNRQAPVFIQSFEVSNLQRLRTLTDVPLVQLIDSRGAPYDVIASGGRQTYRDIVAAEGLAKVARYADAIGVHKDLVIPRTARGRLGQPTGAVLNAHAAGLSVHAWTFRAENTFLPVELRSGESPAAAGDLAGEITAFLSTGLDGFFTDHPDLGVRARDQFIGSRRGTD